MTRTKRALSRAGRIASLFVPPGVAWYVALSARTSTGLAEAVTWALGPLWIVAFASAMIRLVDGLRGRDELGAFARIDVLTPPGTALAWFGASSIAIAVWSGWASLVILGLVGSALLEIVVIWTLWRAGGADPWRSASLVRRFVPRTAVEGDSVLEEVTFSNPRIPAGFNLLATGRVGARWPVSRYVLDTSASNGEVSRASTIDPALRGEHEAEPLTVWLEDVFGLCRSVATQAGGARLTVLPRAIPVDGAEALLGRPGAGDLDRPERLLPTEGSFRMREYQPGDDARRIHWARSLSAREIVVRLPDEVPPPEPAIRLVLDTHRPPCGRWRRVDPLSSDAADALLDALVGVWLGTGRALAAAGARVTLVTADEARGGSVAMRLTRESLPGALRLGARARWQAEVPLDRLHEPERRSISVVVSCRLQLDPSPTAPVRWIVVQPATWTVFERTPPPTAWMVLPAPAGSSDNRRSNRRAEEARYWREKDAHVAFLVACRDTARPGEGGVIVARPSPGRARLEVVR